jgi:hypothetical protein
VGATFLAEAAHSDAECNPEPWPIVVSPAETTDGIGFYIGVDRTFRSFPGSSISTPNKYAAEPEVTAAIEIAREIVISHGWSMQLIQNDSGVRIEITISENRVSDGSSLSRDRP